MTTMMTHEHLERYKQLVAARGWEGKPLDALGGEYSAAFYLMSSRESIFALTAKHVSREGIDFEKILRIPEQRFEYNSHKNLMRLAANLFWSEPVKDLDCSEFGKALLKDAVAAMCIREYGLREYVRLDPHETPLQDWSPADHRQQDSVSDKLAALGTAAPPGKAARNIAPER